MMARPLGPVIRGMRSPALQSGGVDSHVCVKVKVNVHIRMTLEDQRKQTSPSAKNSTS
jgi:hypothetical protein